MPSKKDTVDHLPIEELRKRVTKAIALIGEVKALFPDLVKLTEDDRKHSQGRMRHGEPAILRSVLDAVDLEPQYFKSLADEDEGHDPNKFETDLLRERLERRELYQQVADALEPFTADLSDTALHFGGLVRPAALAAYRIAKTLAHTDQKMRNAVAAAIDFFKTTAKPREARKPE